MMMTLNFVPYSGTNLLLMGDGSCVRIASMGNYIIMGLNRILHLSNI